MSFTKVAPNDPCHFFILPESQNMAARTKKHIFLAVFRKRCKNDGFLALAAIFLRFRQNKKNLEQ